MITTIISFITDKLLGSKISKIAILIIFIGILSIFGVYYIKYTKLNADYTSLQSELILKNTQIMLFTTANAQNKKALEDIKLRYSEMEDRLNKYNKELSDIAINDEQSNQWIESVPPSNIRKMVK